MPVSGFTGANMKERLTKKICPFYDGPSLLELLDTMAMTDRKVNAPLMMPISEKYKDMGTVVVGKIESGRIRRGDSVIIMPNKVSTARVFLASVCVHSPLSKSPSRWSESSGSYGHHI